MKKSNLLVLLSAVAIVTSTGTTYASQGRGGGDPLALEFKATAAVALKNLRSMTGKPFSGLNIDLLQTKITSAQVLVSDNTLSVEKAGITQKSAAENRPKQNLIILNRPSYTKIKSPFVRQALALHELLSLAGIESTGNYPISGAYLITEEGITADLANQTIGAAKMAVTIQTPCSKPVGNAATLFSMIMTPTTPAQAVQSYIQTNIVAGDVLDDQCETVFDVSVDQNRQDIFQVLFEQYKPNLSRRQPQSGNSIYSYVLSRSIPSFLDYIRSLTLSSQQPLSLDPVYEDGIVVSVDGNNGYPTGVTELMIAAGFNPSESMTQYLIQKGALVGGTDQGGRTALMYASSFTSNPSIIQALLAAHAGVNAVETLDQSSSLSMAASYNPNVDVIEALIHGGAAINAKDAYGRTPLMNTIANWNESVEGIVSAFIQAKADLSVVDQDGSTALSYAAQLHSSMFVQSLDLTKMLLQAGADVNCGSLYFAIKNANLKLVQALLQAGANINTDIAGQTLLMTAAAPSSGTSYQEPDQDQIIETLIQAGADVSAKNFLGETALDIAKSSNAPQSLIELLGG